MRQSTAMLTFALAACAVNTGCGAGGAGSGLPLLLPLPLPIPIPAGALNDTAGLLEGQWIISDSAAARSCLVIQELRVSIVDVSCSRDGSGFSSRIIDAPTITRAADTFIIRVTYNLRSDPERVLRLIFTGDLQADGTLIGFRRDEDLSAEIVIPERFAIMTRP